MSGRLTGSLALSVPLALLFLLVVYPLAAIVIQSVFPKLFALHPSLAISLAPLTDVFTNRGSYQSIVVSAVLGLCTAASSAVLGTILAICARRTLAFMGGTIDLLVWVVFFTPSFLLGEAWTILMFRGGTIDHFIHLPDWVIHWFFSPFGVWFVLTLKNFPFVFLPVSAALVWLGSEYEDAARIQGARPWRVWMQINAPLLLPAILAGALIVFAEAVSDFGTAATIGQNASVSLITYQIYESINTFPVDFSRAAALSLLLFASIAVALYGQNRMLRGRSFHVIHGRSRPPRDAQAGRWRWVALAFVTAVLAFALFIPLAECVLLSFQHAFSNGIEASNFTLFNYRAVLAQGTADRTALGLSTWLALGAATVVSTLGLPVAYIVTQTKLPGRKLLGFITLVTIAVPGIVLACGYIFAWNSPFLQAIGIGGRGQIHFYGTVWILLAAYVGGSLPYAIRLNMGALQHLSPSLIEAARIQGAGPFRVLGAVIAPILRSGIVSLWLLVFTGTMFELAASELLYPPGRPTMPVRITFYFGNFRIEQGMALAMCNIGIVTLMVMAIRFGPRLWAFRTRMQSRGAR